MKCSEFESMLDALIDGEANKKTVEMMQKHAETCENCSKQLQAAKTLRAVLSHMDDSLTVPLKAQASWRQAVSAQARKNRLVRFSRIAGAAAAVLVLAVCLPMMLKSSDGAIRTRDAYVEVDGVDEMSLLEGSYFSAVEPSVQATEQPDAIRSVMVEDADVAYGYALDLIAEYTATLESETQSEGEYELVISVPTDNAEAFIMAIDQLGTPLQDSYQNEAIGDMVRVSVRLIAE